MEMQCWSNYKVLENTRYPLDIEEWGDRYNKNIHQSWSSTQWRHSTKLVPSRLSGLFLPATFDLYPPYTI